MSSGKAVLITPGLAVPTKHMHAHIHVNTSTHTHTHTTLATALEEHRTVISCILHRNKKFLDICPRRKDFIFSVLGILKGTPTAFQLCKQAIILGDVECKIIVYLQRVSRSLSLCSSCFLSVYQVIAISSVSSKCAGLKGRILNSIVPSCIFIWILNLLFDMNVPWYVTGSINKTNSDLHMNMGYCSIDWHALIVSKMMTLKTLYDAVFLGFLAIASGYLVLVLYRHHWQVQHIHNTKLNPSISPVISATKVILLLMIIFISFYSASSIFVNVRATNSGGTLGEVEDPSAQSGNLLMVSGLALTPLGGTLSFLRSQGALQLCLT
ncbi:vomeronasal type-1 receptor 4-like [Sarcophilus harrisii]